ncbi:MAG TPA: hypothetical protein VET51_13620, partial [Burkholderiales bacterium]|nr:hypothetical protein [Burkholderiales bacterium]
RAAHGGYHSAVIRCSAMKTLTVRLHEPLAAAIDGLPADLSARKKRYLRGAGDGRKRSTLRSRR